MAVCLINSDKLSCSYDNMYLGVIFWTQGDQSWHTYYSSCVQYAQVYNKHGYF